MTCTSGHTGAPDTQTTTNTHRESAQGGWQQRIDTALHGDALADTKTQPHVYTHAWTQKHSHTHTHTRARGKPVRVSLRLRPFPFLGVEEPHGDAVAIHSSGQHFVGHTSIAPEQHQTTGKRFHVAAHRHGRCGTDTGTQDAHARPHTRAHTHGHIQRPNGRTIVG